MGAMLERIGMDNHEEEKGLLVGALEVEPPLSGRWHHGNGVLVCGGVRIAREDFDTQPCDSVKTELLDWMCETLNARQDSFFGCKKS